MAEGQIYIHFPKGVMKYKGPLGRSLHYDGDIERRDDGRIVPSGRGILYEQVGGKWFLSYDGGFQDGVRHGVGAAYDCTGRLLYEGNHISGQRIDTNAFLLLATKIKYQGAVANGKPHGQGTMAVMERNNRLRVIKGIFDNGNCPKIGTRCFYRIVDDDKVLLSSYTGGLARFGDMEGEGTITWRNGDTYEGEFKYNNCHGKGTMTYDRGDVYHGAFEHGMRHGNGLYVYADGPYKSYVGGFRDGEMHGFGKMLPRNGEMYAAVEGVWMNGAYKGNSKRLRKWANARTKRPTVDNAESKEPVPVRFIEDKDKSVAHTFSTAYEAFLQCRGRKYDFASYLAAVKPVF